MFHKAIPFYLSKGWRHLREEVLNADRYECQHCKAKGKLYEGTHVHHVNHLDKHPELALEKYYKDSNGNMKRTSYQPARSARDSMPSRTLTHAKSPLNEERWYINTQ
jgi:5-methylcytosine-specific restriction endonuclease McrA